MWQWFLKKVWQTAYGEGHLSAAELQAIEDDDQDDEEEEEDDDFAV